MKQPKYVLFIDGENFFFKIKHILKQHKVKDIPQKLTQLDYNALFQTSLKNRIPREKVVYVARLKAHPDTPVKSERLIAFQRKIRNVLAAQGFRFYIAGTVRGQKAGSKVVFKEKGVDVHIAVDMISRSCDGSVDTIILCSSDSDLQPAVKEATRRNVKVVYLGFEGSINYGLRATTSETCIVRKESVLSMVQKKNTLVPLSAGPSRVRSRK